MNYSSCINVGGCFLIHFLLKIKCSKGEAAVNQPKNCKMVQSRNQCNTED